MKADRETIKNEAIKLFYKNNLSVDIALLLGKPESLISEMLTEHLEEKEKEKKQHKYLKSKTHLGGVSSCDTLAIRLLKVALKERNDVYNTIVTTDKDYSSVRDSAIIYAEIMELQQNINTLIKFNP